MKAMTLFIYFEIFAIALLLIIGSLFMLLFITGNKTPSSREIISILSHISRQPELGRINLLIWSILLIVLSLGLILKIVYYGP
jgi:hypothetical protein